MFRILVLASTAMYSVQSRRFIIIKCITNRCRRSDGEWKITSRVCKDAIWSYSNVLNSLMYHLDEKHFFQDWEVGCTHCGKILKTSGLYDSELAFSKLERQITDHFLDLDCPKYDDRPAIEALHVDLPEVESQEVPTTCPICQDLFVYPYVLGCHHLFCMECLHNVLKNLPVGNKTCPLCREKVEVETIEFEVEVDMAAWSVAAKLEQSDPGSEDLAHYWKRRHAWAAEGWAYRRINWADDLAHHPGPTYDFWERDRRRRLSSSELKRRLQGP